MNYYKIKSKMCLFKLLIGLVIINSCQMQKKESKFKNPQSNMEPLYINSIDFIGFIEELHKKHPDTLMKWVRTELVPGRTIISEDKQGIICDRAMREWKVNGDLIKYCLPRLKERHEHCKRFYHSKSRKKEPHLTVEIWATDIIKTNSAESQKPMQISPQKPGGKCETRSVQCRLERIKKDGKRSIYKLSHKEMGAVVESYYYSGYALPHKIEIEHEQDLPNIIEGDVNLYVSGSCPPFSEYNIKDLFQEQKLKKITLYYKHMNKELSLDL